MQNRSQRLDLLTVPAFLLALALLLLNDWVWKTEYGNWFTGKLSDFAGLFVFPIFWTAIFPKHKHLIFTAVAVFFIFWKSPFSQCLIGGWNTLGMWQIGRVVDYSDLLALSVLPLAFRFCNRSLPALPLKVNPVFPMMISIFAFTATSRADGTVAYDKPYLLKMSKNDFEKGLQKLTQEDASNFYSGFSNSNPDTITIRIKTEACPRLPRYDLLITVLNDSSIIVSMLSCETICDDEDDRIKMRQAFESGVIDKIRNSKSLPSSPSK
ncbi:MAG: hypothetical protein KF734_00605 [Saprospiraceae bacterium]|nr:hypothetical protein [Saprospiraceae bacterium]